MRALRFRAWDKSDGRMIKLGWGWINEDGAIPVRGDWDDIVHEDELEFMQFTGLKDEQGREVYEGDIVDCAAIGVHRGAVTWMDPGLFYGVVSANAVHGMYNGWTVIGNIYENPELLKEAK